ncbi:hypothetical protein CJF30_00002374 [Rutstroemia sp. NJR-2017a BBW]|nr:hypothetical protein CJF30_00002374 [Rutstroemia sp. NJR-2017a BBW]
MTYALANPAADTDEADITALLTKQLDQCKGTPGELEVGQYESQLSKLSSLASQWSATVTSVNATAGTATAALITTTMHPTSRSSWTGSLRSETGDWTTILSTATWASAYYSRLSEASATATSNSSSTPVPFPISTFTTTSQPTITPSANLTVLSAPETTSSSTLTTSTTTPVPALSKTWVIGPVIGSILGLSTVFVVIYFTRQKQHQQFLVSQRARHQPIIIDPNKWFPGSPSPTTTGSHNSMDWTIHGLTGGKAQLHGESMEMRELMSTEVSPPAELPAAEPVGMELLAPRGKSVRRKRKREDTSMERGREGEDEDEGGDVGLLRIPGSGGGVHDDEDDEDDVNWPLPMSPLQQIFKSTEMRDGKVEEVKHETYYHP